MHQLITSRLSSFDGIKEHLTTELAGLRGNRAHPSLVEDVSVEVYGSTMKLKEVASISVPEPRTLQVQPWDKGALKDIERGLVKANTGAGIKNDGAVLHVSLPPLTAESRAELVRVVHTKVEAARVQLKQLREQIREDIVKGEREKTLTEDERYAAQEELDKLVRERGDELAALGKKKEEEVTTV